MLKRFIALLQLGVPPLLVAALHRLGADPWLRVTSNPIDWLVAASLERAVAAGLRYLGLGLGYWLTVSTLAYLAARLTGAASALRLAARFTLPPVRRAVNRLLAGSLALSTLLSPSAAMAGAEPGGPVYVPEPYRRVVPPPDAKTVPATQDRVEVGKGDHFWKLAHQRLRAVKGREPSTEEVAAYWVEVVEANRHRIRSGNPDLIYPGEIVLLPPIGS